MRSALRGKTTLEVEVTNLERQGFWLLLDNREVFVAFAAFPWFEDATIRQITTVERPSPHHLHWPELDIDLAVDSLEHPERFPLVSRARPNRPLQRPGTPRKLRRSVGTSGQRRPRR